MKIIIKTMETPEEIEGKSLVHWQTWREAYDNLLPAEYQETMTLDRCRFFSQKYPENTLIAKIISEPLLSIKKWVLLLMVKKKCLNLENLLRNCG